MPMVDIIMKLNDKLFRSRYYLQLGWQVYLAIIFALANFITISHFFVIENNLILKNLFTDLIWFGVMITIIVFPTAALLGYLHIKCGARRAENYISYQVNPYFARRLVNSQMVLNTYLIISKLLVKTSKLEELTKDESDSFIHEIEVMKNVLQSRTFSNKLDLKYIRTES